MKFLKSGYHGLYFPELNIAMDGYHPSAEYTFVSHAHADHIPKNRHTKAFATQPTLKLMARRGFKGESHAMTFHKTLQTSRFSATLYPAGHILGSAMIYIETPEETLLYTGDYRTPPSPATEGFDAPDHADILITEATFALPIYRWKSHNELIDEIQSFAADCLKNGYTPVFLGYNLGKAQEIMHILAPLNHPVQIHGAGYKLCEVYDEHDIDLGNYEPYDRDTCEGKILIAPSSAISSGFASNVLRKKIAYCSGWAANESRRTQLTADKLIPLSDHLDFFELIEFCKRLSPKEVYITHTPNPDVLRHYLDNLGIENRFLDFEMEAED